MSARARQLAAAGTQVIAQAVDVSDAAQVSALADAAYAHFGAVHLLCNNAGVAAPAHFVPAWESPPSDWQWIMAVNLMGVVHGLRAFVPRMLAADEEGHIVNTASTAGLLSASGPYYASKQGVVCVTEGLYQDLRRRGAKVSASVLCPGLIRTAIADAERNRPAWFGASTDLSALPEQAREARAAFSAALETGYEPAVVADAVADAVLQDRFYIVVAQPAIVERIRARMQDITLQRNPAT